MGRCNNRREPSSRGLVLEGLSRPGVEPRGDGVEVDLGEDREIGLLGEVLAEQAVGRSYVCQVVLWRAADSMMR